jgi:uncharacterized protein (TIRG00374 family)
MINGRAVRFFAPFVVSLIFVVLVIRGVQSEASQLTGGELSSQLVTVLANASWWLVVPGIALYFVGVWIRSIRWGLLLPEHDIPVSTLFQTLVIGFTVNNLLPFRMGEVARCYLLARWCSVSYGATVASLVVERVLDGLSLAVLLFVALLLWPTAPGYLRAVEFAAGVGFLAGAIVLALAAWRASLVTSLAGWVSTPLPRGVAEKIVRLTENFARSLALVHDPSRLARVLGLSLVAWCIELGLFFVLLLALALPASYPLALLVGSAANFATLIPSSPGYAGTFDSAVIKILTDSAGVSAVQALAYDVAVHAALWLPVVVVGTLLLWRSHMTFDQITHGPQVVSEGVQPVVAR